jgi:hypothetical protein
MKVTTIIAGIGILLFIRLCFLYVQANAHTVPPERLATVGTSVLLDAF